MMRTFEVLILSVFLSRFIYNKNELGQILQVIFVSALMVTVVSGIPLSLNFFHGKYFNQNKTNKGNLFNKFFLLLISISLTLCLVVFVSRGLLADSFQNTLFYDHITIILTYLFLKSSNSIFPNQHFLSDKLSNYIVLFFSSTVLLILFLSYDLEYNRLVAPVILKQLAVIEVIRLLVNIIIVRPTGIKSYMLTLNKDERRYLLTISMGVILGSTSLYADKYLVASLLNPTQFVFYQNGAINLPFVNIITSSFFIASIPFFASLYTQNNINQLLAETKQAIIKCAVFLIPILVYCFFEAFKLIDLLYGEGFDTSGRVFRVYILRYSFSVMAYSIFMGSIGLEKKSNIVIFVAGVLSIGFNLLLIPAEGVIGASWATVISSLLSILLSLYYINKGLGVKLRMYFPVADYLKIVSLSIIVYLPFYFLNNSFNNHFVVVCLALIYYIIVLFIFNFKFINLNKLLKR